MGFLIFWLFSIVSRKGTHFFLLLFFRWVWALFKRKIKIFSFYLSYVVQQSPVHWTYERQVNKRETSRSILTCASHLPVGWFRAEGLKGVVRMWDLCFSTSIGERQSKWFFLNDKLALRKIGGWYYNLWDICLSVVPTLPPRRVELPQKEIYDNWFLFRSSAFKQIGISRVQIPCLTNVVRWLSINLSTRRSWFDSWPGHVPGL